jgi:hypothetical protein
MIAVFNRRLYFLFILFIILSIDLLGEIVDWQSLPDTFEGILIVVLGLACLAPVIIRLLQKRLDVFEPVYAFSLSTFVYFVVVPIFLIRDDAFYIEGINYHPEIKHVLMLAIMALLGFYWGYHWPQKVENQKKPTNWNILNNLKWKHSLTRWSIILFGFFFGLVILWILTSRVPLRALWVIGQGSYGDPFLLASGLQIGYLYGARDALPACLLLLFAAQIGGRWRIGLLPVLLVTIPLIIGDGVRSRIVILVVSLFIFYYLQRQKRPSAPLLLATVFFIYYLIVGGVGYYRSQPMNTAVLRVRGTENETFTLSEAWNTFFEGSQVVTSTALLVRTFPQQIGYLRGISFLNVFIQPIPRFLWPDKPRMLGPDSLNYLWPLGTAAPFWSLFYVNFGSLGVILGMALWGYLSRCIYEAYRRNPINPLTQMQLAVYFPFIIHAYGRGEFSLAFILYGAIFVLAPIWLAGWWVRRETRNLNMLKIDGEARPL